MNDRHDQPNPRRDHRAAADQAHGDNDQLASRLRDADPAAVAAADQPHDDDNQLASRLRDADPAADEAVIAPAELAAMRRALIAAADAPASSKRWSLETPRPRAALPMAAAAGAAALALWLLGPTVLAPVVPSPPAQPARSSDSAPDAITDVPGARASGPARQPSADPSVAVLPETTVLPPAVSPAGSLPAATADRPAIEAPAARSIVPEAERATVGNTPPTRENTRTVHFVAPGGTRIIWTIDPNFEPPIAGPSARKENGK